MLLGSKVRSILIWFDLIPALLFARVLCAETSKLNSGKTVVRLEYEGYVPMAERVMQSICAQVGQRVTYACMAQRVVSWCSPT